MPGGAGGGASGGGSNSQPQSWEGPSLSPRRGSLNARGRGGTLSRGSKDALAASELRGSGLAGRRGGKAESPVAWRSRDR